jgi:hypothetical protein
MDRYRLEDKGIAVERRDMERLLSMHGRKVTGLDDLFLAPCPHPEASFELG